MRQMGPGFVYTKLWDWTKNGEKLNEKLQSISENTNF